MSAWQLIETCPATGLFIVYEDEAMRMLWRYEGEWKNTAFPVIVSPFGDSIVGKDASYILPAGYKLALSDGMCTSPTHWMPLPDAPK